MSSSAQHIKRKGLVRMKDGQMRTEEVFTLLDREAARVSGLSFADGEGEAFAPWSGVRSYEEDVIVVADWQAESEGIDIIGLPVLSETGRHYGAIHDFSFEKDGQLEWLLLGDADTLHMVPADALSFVGEDALFLKTPVDESLWQTLDERLFREEDRADFFNAKEVFDLGVEDVNSLIQKAWRRLGKDLPVAELGQWGGKVQGKVQRTLGAFMDDVNERLRELRSKGDEEAIHAVYKDLGGKSVKKAIFDDDGNELLHPGQVITEERIKAVIRADKIFDLYRLSSDFSDLESETPADTEPTTDEAKEDAQAAPNDEETSQE